MSIKKAYVAWGCFWGFEELFRKIPGVVVTEVWYMWGLNDEPTYQDHPGHAEALEITYDTSMIDYTHLLDYFFRYHDPTTLDRQGNDRGSSYRSAIFYQDEQELELAKSFIAKVSASGRWMWDIVTTLEKYEKFWPAESYHQDYLQKNPHGYTCHFERWGTYL